jgi:hypothetical protein
LVLPDRTVPGFLTVPPNFLTGYFLRPVQREWAFGLRGADVIVFLFRLDFTSSKSLLINVFSFFLDKKRKKKIKGCRKWPKNLRRGLNPGKLAVRCI